MAAMRRILRILGALLLAVAMVLLVMDGTHTLASSALVVTPLGGAWSGFFPGTLEPARIFIETSVHPLLWEPVATTLLSWPGWAVLGGLGAVLALAGRTPNRRRLVSIDQL